jgi:hypothetical protein
MRNVALRPRWEDIDCCPGMSLRQSDISAAGGDVALAIDAWGIDVHDSRITATGGAESNMGAVGAIELFDTVVHAGGGREAIGVAHIDDELTGSTLITGGAVTASAQETALAVTVVGLLASFDRTRIVATSAGEAIGLSWLATDIAGLTAPLSQRLESVFVHSPGAALAIQSRRNYEGQETPKLTVLRSQLIGGTRAIEIRDDGSDLPIEARIEGSVMQAVEWAATTMGGAHVLTISGSILDGVASVTGGQLTCTDVLGGDYRPLDSRCLPKATTRR